MGHLKGGLDSGQPADDVWTLLMLMLLLLVLVLLFRLQFIWRNRERELAYEG
jgi:hypothetical protein